MMMGTDTDINPERAHHEDAAEILALQKLACQNEAKIYNDFSIPPLTRTLAEMEDALARKAVLKITDRGRIVGSVRAFEQGGTCHIGRVIVHPEWQGRGLGRRLMGTIEARFPAAERFELFTGHRSVRNLYLYRKVGYERFKTEEINPAQSLVFLEKRRQRP